MSRQRGMIQDFSLALLTEANPSTLSAPGNSGALLIVIGFTCWCWLGAGPRFFRWLLLFLLAALTSGHWAGSIAGYYLNTIAQPLLVLLIMAVGISIMFHGFSGRRAPERRPSYREGRWCGDRQ